MIKRSSALTYNDRNRLSQLTRNGTPTASYRYNGKGERVYKATEYPQPDYRWFSYDEAGHLLGEYHSSGSRDIVWIDQTPIALLDTTGVSYPAADQLFGDGFDLPPVPTTTIYYVHSDQLDTPRAVTTTAGTKVWSWDFKSNPFGDKAPNEDPDANGNKFVLNLRFAGQWIDLESGTFYNYLRDNYLPSDGRYLQSDPIGLRGGISLFGYVEANPLKYIDPRGLAPIPCSGNNGRTVCDGNGGFMIENCNNTCTRECTQIHEEVHLRDLQREYPTSCRGRPRGSDPALTVKNVQDAYNFKKETECRAHRAGKSCGEKLCNSKCCDAANDYVKQQEQWLETYRCNAVYF